MSWCDVGGYRWQRDLRGRLGIVAECAVVAFSAFALGPELAGNQAIFVWLRVIRLCALRTAPLVLVSILVRTIIAHSLALWVIVGIVSVLRAGLLVLSRHLGEDGT